MIALKTILMTAAGAEFMMGNVKFAFWVAVATGVLNEAANFLTSKKDDTENGKS